MPRCEREPVPSTVAIRSSPRRPTTQSDVGVAVAVRANGTPRNRLVTIGDSLTHGFQSGAIHNTDLSFPAIIAWELGWFREFRHPAYPGFGGIPLNLEVLIGELERRLGDAIAFWELPAAMLIARKHLAEAEHWWGWGPGTIAPAMPGISHNLGVYGWDLRDVLSRHADNAGDGEHVPSGWQVVPLVRNADAIAAKRVLESARDENGTPRTPLQAAKALGDEGSQEDGTGDGIETLIVLIGANCALGSVVGLCVRWSGEGYDDLRAKGAYNVWRPEHFRTEFRRVTDQVRQIRARHVIFGTIPHVTIPPVARGVGGKLNPRSRYFHHYTRPWIADEDFDVRGDAHLTADDARAVDSAIDQYNATIVGEVRKARREGRDWRLLDLAGLLDRLAARRYFDSPEARPAWWTRYELPAAVRALAPEPDSRFFAAGAAGRTRGGLFSLDGVHPTTITYGMMAQEFMNVMRAAGVTFYHPDGATPRADPVEVNWPRVIARDGLISHPPRSVSADLKLIAWLDERIDILNRLWAGITGR